jgi:hypothetical protein
MNLRLIDMDVYIQIDFSPQSFRGEIFFKNQIQVVV